MQTTTVYYYRDARGRLQETYVVIEAQSMAEAKRLAKAQVGQEGKQRLVDVIPLAGRGS